MKLRNFQEARLLFRGIDAPDAGSERPRVVHPVAVESKAERPENPDDLQIAMETMAAVVGGRMDEVIANKGGQYPKKLVNEVAELKRQFAADQERQASERRNNGGFLEYKSENYREYTQVLETEVDDMELSGLYKGLVEHGMEMAQKINKEAFIDGVMEICKRLNVAPEKGILEKLHFKKGDVLEFNRKSQDRHEFVGASRDKIEGGLWKLKNDPRLVARMSAFNASEVHRACYNIISSEAENLGLDFEGLGSAFESEARGKFVLKIISLCKEKNIIPPWNLLERSGFKQGENIDDPEAAAYKTANLIRYFDDRRTKLENKTAEGSAE